MRRDHYQYYKETEKCLSCEMYRLYKYSGYIDNSSHECWKDGDPRRVKDVESSIH